jgi:hypothetical protein
MLDIIRTNVENKQVNSNRLKTLSTHENLRLCIIENSIFIEEYISHLLGKILNIKWETSKSFGFGSTSLSFNQKVHLIQDIKSLNKEEIQRLTCLMNIRNKFVHTSVSTFDDLFIKTSIGKEIKKNFLKWYFDADGIDDIHPTKLEVVFRHCFYSLVGSIFETLKKVLEDHLFELGRSEGRKEFAEKLAFEFADFIRSLNEGQSIVNEIIDKAKKDSV